jgi:hypothetical protein
MDLWLLSIFGLILFFNIVYLFVMLGKKEIKPKKMLTNQLFLNFMMLFVFVAIFISATIKI